MVDDGAIQITPRGHGQRTGPRKQISSRSVMYPVDGDDDVMAKVIEIRSRSLSEKSEAVAPRPAWDGDRVSPGKVSLSC